MGELWAATVTGGHEEPALQGVYEVWNGWPVVDNNYGSGFWVGDALFGGLTRGSGQSNNNTRQPWHCALHGLRSGRGKEARFRYWRTMTVTIADRKSGKPLFCAVWMLLYEDESRSVEGPDVSRGGPEGTAP